jgi:hypothetical protein
MEFFKNALKKFMHFFQKLKLIFPMPLKINLKKFLRSVARKQCKNSYLKYFSQFQNKSNLFLKIIQMLRYSIANNILMFLIKYLSWKLLWNYWKLNFCQIWILLSLMKSSNFVFKNKIAAEKEEKFLLKYYKSKLNG